MGSLNRDYFSVANSIGVAQQGAWDVGAFPTVQWGLVMKNLLFKIVFRSCLLLSICLIVVPIVFLLPILTDDDAVISYLIPSTNWYPSWIMTLLYGVLTTFFQAMIGMFLASVFFFLTWGSNWKTVLGLAVLILPYSIPSSISVMIFDFAFAENGYLTNLFNFFGWTDNSLLNKPSGRFFVMCLVSIWQYTPFFFVTVLVGFIAVPNGLVSQARCDGASPIQVLMSILLPIAYPIIYAGIVLRLILMLGKVDISLAYFNNSIIGGAETLPVQAVHNIFSYSNTMPLGIITLLALILLGPIIIYYFLIFNRK